MTKKLIYCILFLSNVLNAQNTIRVTKEGGKPIPQASIYQNDSLVNVTNDAGYATIRKTSIPIAIVKSGYYDTIVEYRLLNNSSIHLKKIEAINLGDLTIKVTKEHSIEDVFKKVLEHLEHNTPYNQDYRNYHLYNLYLFNQDTLVYINERIYSIENKYGKYLDLQNSPQINYKRLITRDSLGKESMHQYCEIKKEKISLGLYSPLYKSSFSNNDKLRSFLINNKTFQLKTKRFNNKLIVNYYPKKQKAFSYTGMIIINLIDYSIDYFKSSLITHKKNKSKSGYYDLVPIRDYQHLKDEYEVFLRKNPSDNLSTIVSETYSSSYFTSIEGEEILFTQNYIIEPSNVFNKIPKNQILYFRLYEYLNETP
ncbi:MAG: hypothetical protein RQ756_05580 [Flavobacteriaceae bacterium]|nr:hypothetical protein [Flavobacteriaceae bacterium]